MGNSNGVKNSLFEYCAIVLALSMTSSVSVLMNESIYFLITRCSILLLFVLFIPYFKKDINKLGILYCGAITIGFFLHKIEGLDANVYTELMVRLATVFLLLHYSCGEKYSNKGIHSFILVLFLLECTMAVFERLTLTHLIDYNFDTQAMSADMYLSEEFRSFALMGHPLVNANIISIMLAFIICSSSIKTLPKVLLVLLGLGAIWAFNSRAAMMMWLFLIFYRLFLYGKSLKWWIVCVVVTIIVLPSLFLFVQKSGYLGRLDFDFSDGSTFTRIMAIDIFMSYPWSIRDMLFGGVVLEQPTYGGVGAVDYVLIENGYLLDLGYWGFLLGTVKIVCEFLLSYQALKMFRVRDKVIIMIATWGVASMNNNTASSFLLVFYMCSYLAFGMSQNYHSKNKAKVCCSMHNNKRQVLNNNSI